MDGLNKLRLWLVMIFTRQVEVASLKRYVKVRDDLLEAYAKRDAIAEKLIETSRTANTLRREVVTLRDEIVDHIDDNFVLQQQRNDAHKIIVLAMSALEQALLNEGQDGCLSGIENGCLCWRCKARAAIKKAKGDQ